MANKKTTGPEIEPWEMPPPSRPAGATAATPPLSDVLRHSFRGMVSEADQAIVEIAGQRYPILDIGSRGIGIVLPDGKALVVGQTYDLVLEIKKYPFPLRGVVKHLTRNEGDATFLVGIQLLDLDGEAEERLQAFVLRQRQALQASKK